MEWTQTLTAGFEVKAFDDGGAFEGYASVFEAIDEGRDIVLPGAFKASIEERGANGIKLLWQHDPAEPVGRIEEIFEDKRGLYVKGRLLLNLQRAREALSLMRDGALDGLSIGFRTLKSRMDEERGVRLLIEVDLWEVSLVTFPMQPRARIAAFKKKPIHPASPRLRRAYAQEALNCEQECPPKLYAKEGDGLHPPKTPDLAERRLNMPKSSPPNPSPVEIKAAVERLGQAFEEFKKTNNAAEAEKRARGAVDALLEQKLKRINADVSRLQRSVDQLHAGAARPHLGGGGAASPDAEEHKAAFYDHYIRKGLEAGLAGLEGKAFSVGTDAEGGYAVPEELDRTIEKLLRDVSPIRRIATVAQVGSSNYRKLVNIGGTGSGWASETGARAETDTPQFSEIVPPLGELYANPAATQRMLDDAFFNVEEWLAGELAQEFAEMEGAAFVAGDGVNKPKGFLTYPTATVDDSTRAFGTLQHVITGADGDFPASNPTDKLFDIVYALRTPYRAGASFVMNTNLVAEIRKFKNAEGNYLWRPGLADGAPATLLGYPVIEAEDMPDKAAGSLSVAFGNFTRGYIVTDRMGTRILRDPYSNKPFVHFYTTKRVGGALVNSEAIKLLKFSLA